MILDSTLVLTSIFTFPSILKYTLQTLSLYFSSSKASSLDPENKVPWIFFTEENRVSKNDPRGLESIALQKQNKKHGFSSVIVITVMFITDNNNDCYHLSNLIN